MHISCMRGSPLVRSLFILFALIGTGFGFYKLTATNAAVAADVAGTDRGQNPSEESVELIEARVELVFSSLPVFFELKAGEKPVTLENDGGGIFSGKTVIDPKMPVMFLKVSSAPPESGGQVRNFAKLVVEAEGRKTFTHVFDSSGDIDDFVELPF